MHNSAAIFFPLPSRHAGNLSLQCAFTMLNAWLLIHFPLLKYHPSLRSARLLWSKWAVGRMYPEPANKTAATEQCVSPDKERL